MARYPKPSVTVDAVVFSILDDQLKVLLIKRSRPPFQGRWALPGGFIEIEEPLHVAAKRELEEETGVQVRSVRQLYTFGDPGRDPRGRTISVVHYALVRADHVAPQAASDAAAVNWFSAFRLPKLAFDHREILHCAIQRLQHDMEWSTAAFELSPPRFTLTELRRVYEIILRRPIEPRAFKRKILSQLQPVESSREREGKANRTVRLYTCRACSHSSKARRA